ncbi:hypothetical protein [Leifsonia sp. P73]|uniref:hypothetical protein n=1 Tax=Leifsonia sp. P73 TaxID=3423959 RepID=UPI003DA55163
MLGQVEHRLDRLAGVLRLDAGEVLVDVGRELAQRLADQVPALGPLGVPGEPDQTVGRERVAMPFACRGDRVVEGGAHSGWGDDVRHKALLRGVVVSVFGPRCTADRQRVP